ncbi:glycosyltransferase family 4 protein [Flammeovirga pacifica]|uniref:Glycosyl transferase family 1 domain-containing protein n=1 Tax=Flammeovirga pacifica TaxID=915059 RepID=A0A1S1Z116_FLAPC|nr:glycosyltransferase family 4 protein [Flammeovirga pacifica]OHX66959.1 hypothetical protein NH26_11690 [Flammeovirga pacifica]
MKKINFTLPFPPDHPGGGTKMVFENANYLAKKGYDVAIYSNSLTKGMHKGNKWVKYFKNRLSKKYIPKWFDLDKSIQHFTVPEFKDRFIRDADVIISTWHQTAIDCSKLSDKKGKKINYVQDYEIWDNREETVHQSYQLNNVEFVVISKYLEKILTKFSSNVHFIPYGIDTFNFQIKTPINERNPYSISMLYSEEARKNVHVAIEALKILKKEFPQLEAHFFGVKERSEKIPQDWINYYQQPKSVSDIYNNSAIFLQASYQEGLSLNPMEAKASGCASIYTNIDGHIDHSKDNENCLLVPINDVQAFVNKIRLLINDQALRINIAQKGHDHIVSNYSWEKSINKLETLF